MFLYAATSNKTSFDVKPSIQDRIVKKASSMWSSWEAAEKGWKKKVVVWGNKAIDRIDYREHSLKSVMSISAYQRYHPEAPEAKISVTYPASVESDLVNKQISTLAREGLPRHRQKLIYSFILMPLTAPFMLVPVVPNLPFFYVAFRAWSHWRAMQGSEHLQRLIDQGRLSLVPSATLKGIYDSQGQMLVPDLQRLLQARLSMPEMGLEVERANAQLDRLDAQQVAERVTEEEEEANRTRSRSGLHK